jgi:hypothetical protein
VAGAGELALGVLTPGAAGGVGGMRSVSHRENPSERERE